MKALSLTQPWATAIALGIKKWETRSWATGFRGRLAVHAAKGFPGWARKFTADEAMMGRIPRTPPLGAVVALCELVECRRTKDIEPTLGQIERLYGDYSEGRYCFRLENVIALPEPIHARGAPGFWNWECGDLIDVDALFAGKGPSMPQSAETLFK